MSATYDVTVYGWDHESILRVTARSRSQARYLAWLEIEEPTQITFAEFLLKWVRSVRLTDRATRYTYAAEFYGVDVVTGDRVLAGGELGMVAEPPGSNPRHNYIFVLLDSGDGPSPYHPTDVSKVPS